MKITKLGEFEELVLLTVAALQKEAYGVEIKRELEDRLKEKLSVGSIQSGEFLPATNRTRRVAVKENE